MVDMAARVAPFLPARWLVRDRYETARKAPALALPALVIHGTADEVVPYAMGKRVASLLPQGELVTVEGGHHNDLFETPRHDLVTTIAAFARGERR
jgi:pimeloyl-ACP methyl ester carboxylesterase